MLKSVLGLAVVTASVGAVSSYAAAGPKPTVVLVHGAFADASS